jgi:hypothetical protein
MRQPLRLWRELGPAGLTAFQVTVGGTVLSALVHPWFYALVAFDVAIGAFGDVPESALGVVLWTMAAISLVSGYAAGLGLGLIAVQRRGYTPISSGMCRSCRFVSFAAYRALAQAATLPSRQGCAVHADSCRSRPTGRSRNSSPPRSNGKKRSTASAVAPGPHARG